MPKNLFSSNKFKFTLTGERFKDNEFDLTITGINVPGVQLGTIPQGTQVRTVDRPGDSIVFNDLTAEFLITEDWEEWLTIFRWIEDLRDFSKPIFDNSIITDATLMLLTNKSNPNIIINFEDLFPYDLSDLDLTLNSGEGEPIRGTCTFKYINYIVTSIP